jgi:hypothetical protein
MDTQQAIIDQYESLKRRHQSSWEKLNKQANYISILRLVAVIAAGILFYYYTVNSEIWFLALFGILLGVFFLLMNVHVRLSRKRDIAKRLMQINQDEISFLLEGSLPFEDGSILGARSLATALKDGASYELILARQQAASELALLVDFRQKLQAFGQRAQDSEAVYNRIEQWGDTPTKGINKWFVWLSYLLTAALSCAFVVYLFTHDDFWRDTAGRIFTLNLLLFFTQIKKVKQALISGDKIDELLLNYSVVLELIIQQKFEAPYLKQLQHNLEESQAGKQIQKLARIYAGMENIANPFAAIIMNGLYFYHVHQLNKLVRWKQRYVKEIPGWLNEIGQLEMLCSVANFKFNNPSYTFPILNTEGKIAFEHIGHPMIPATKRVTNSVCFADHRFVILTGSNMSGKSTFLRTLGINMVLARMGSVVCAAAATLQPMPLLVSMRQSDSLADNESYFFAEVKRLKFIVDHLSNGPAFVLLDEILRGTNSDDKRSGTIGVIKNMIKFPVVGAIATHDLEVCLITRQHEGTITNKCFEVEIINEELVFDYKLRDGICKNKSATFLMRKMGIIQPVS